MVTTNANFKAESVQAIAEYAKSCVGDSDTDDITMLEDLLIAALNDAYAKADKAYNDKMGAFGGLGL